MAYNDFTIKTFDGLTLNGRDWIPDQEPKAIVNLIHGLGEYSGRYSHVADAFVKAGYMFSTVDLRGHGNSEGPRGHTPNFDALVTDIEFLVKRNRSEYHGKPEFLYGHSLGGEIALYYNLTCDNYVDGVIASSPLIKTGTAIEQSNSGIGRTLADINPTHTNTFGLLYSMLCHDTSVIRAYTADPLVHNRISTKMESEMQKKGEWIYDNRKDLKAPILIIVGSSDRVIDIKKVTSMATGLEDRITLKVWEGLYHETHNEPEKADVIQYNINWLNLRVH